MKLRAMSRNLILSNSMWSSLVLFDWFRLIKKLLWACNIDVQIESQSSFQSCFRTKPAILSNSRISVSKLESQHHARLSSCLSWHALVTFNPASRILTSSSGLPGRQIGRGQLGEAEHQRGRHSELEKPFQCPACTLVSYTLTAWLMQ